MTTTVFKEMTNKLKPWIGSSSSESSSLWFVMQAEKHVQKSAAKFTDAKSCGMKSAVCCM